MNLGVRYIILSFCLFWAVVLKAQTPLQRTLDFEVKQVSIPEALLALSEAAEINIAFNSRLFDPERRINLQFSQTSIEAILKACLAQTGIGFRYEAEQIILYPLPKREYTFSGYVQDAQTGERLLAATVYAPQTGRGTTTNNYGFFSLRLPEGKTQIQVSYLGYQAISLTLQLDQSQSKNIALHASLTLPEIVVNNTDEENDLLRLSAATGLPISADDITRQTALGGEADLFHHLQTLPSVSGGTDGLGGLHVRGGNTDQNLILLDDVPIYNPSHTLGLFSIFNTHSLKSVSFYSDDFSARYGGRLSSVLNVRTREGNTQRLSVEGGLSTLATHLLLDGPLVKDKIGLLISLRRTHIDPVVESISRRRKQRNDEGGEATYAFYDINAKLQAVLSPQDRLYLSFYKGEDNYRNTSDWFWEDLDTLALYDDRQEIRWGNTIAALRWNHLFGDRLFANTTLTYSSYRYRSQNAYNYEEIIGDELFYQDIYFTRFGSVITDVGAKTDFDFYLSPRHHLLFGGGLLRRNFEPGLIEVEEEGFDAELAFDDISNLLDTLYESPVYKATELDAYLEDRMRLNEQLSLSLGVHVAAFLTEGKTYLSFQPRLGLRWKASKVWSASLSAARMTQFLHALTSTGAGLPNDLWVPATDSVGPQQSWQLTATLRADLSNGWGASLTGYYKKMDDLISYEEGATLPSLYENDPIYWEESITLGEGWSRGIEAGLSKSKGPTTFQLSYSYLRSERAFEGTNGGRRYPFRFEHRHSVQLAMQQELKPWLSLKLSWAYGSGQPITLVSSETRFLPLNNLSPAPVDRLSDIHGYRLPAYHRLDASLDFHWQQKAFRHAVSLGVYNAYNRRNPYYVYILDDPFFPEDNGLQKQNSLPLLPSLSYRLTWKQ